MNQISVTELLRENSLRLTKIRKILVESLIKSSRPLTAIEIKLVLQQQNVLCNKTTIYREIQTLLKCDVLKELDFGEGKKRYEIQSSHHHHLVCQSCNIICEINLDLTHFEKQLLILQNKISSNLDFKINQHYLEFYGYCKSCLK